MYGVYVALDPQDKMVFEGPFDELMQQVQCKEFMDVSVLKIICKWLLVSQKYGIREAIFLTHHEFHNDTKVFP
jgi:hypothetical protein